MPVRLYCAGLGFGRTPARALREQRLRPAPWGLGPCRFDSRRARGRRGHPCGCGRGPSRSPWCTTPVSRRQCGRTAPGFPAPRTTLSSRARALAMKLASPARNHSSISSTCGRDRGRHGEAEPDHHARTVEAHRQLQELAQLGELGHVLFQKLDLGGRKAVVEAAEHDVLAAGQVRGSCRVRGPSNALRLPSTRMRPTTGS